MKSVKEIVTDTIVINKSKFINYLIPVFSVEEAQAKLTELRGDYHDANHHCYAYIIGNYQEVQKYSDDGEPSKTAGMPMIEVLKKQDLTNVLTVSIRYFGGIKLGAGGLVRAYTKSVSEAIKKADFTINVKLAKLEIIIPFDEIGHVEKYIRDHFTLLNTTYDNFVHYSIEVLEKEIDIISSRLSEVTKGKCTTKTIALYEEYR